MKDLESNFAFAKDSLSSPLGKATYFNLSKLKELGCDIEQLPFSIRVLLENSIRHSSKVEGAEEAANQLMEWPKSVGKELPFMPARVLLQDYTGVPLIVDLAAMRDAAKSKGLDPRSVNSHVPVDLIVDHSVQVDRWAVDDAIFYNLQKEYERNSERYSLLKWAQTSFSNMRIFPPGKGICHQVNLEYISTVITVRKDEDGLLAFPDSLVGTDSHTPMVNGIAVLGWGVGGIEAEAVMLGEPYHMPIPEVVGVEIVGELREGSTPTDVVLTVTEVLRKKGVVGKFVEFFGESYSKLSAPDRATLGNMAPEYGATVGFSPIDENTLDYLQGTGRDASHVDFVRRYSYNNRLFYEKGVRPKYSEVVVIDLGQVEPSIAGPRNPDERISIKTAPLIIPQIISSYIKKSNRSPTVPISHVDNGYQPIELSEGSASKKSSSSPSSLSLARQSLFDGAVVIAAITSCTNTSNPTVMLGAGLLAKKLVQLGLKPKPYVKTSMAPGSRVVTDYLQNSGLLQYLNQLGFNVVGYGCTTCIGNSGPLAKDVEDEIKSKDLYAVAVLSGNRNFDGRIHPLAKGSFLTSPMMVIAYAIAGRIDFDFDKEPLGRDKDGREIFLKDVWPSMEEIRAAVNNSLNPELYKRRYADATEGDDKWKSLPASAGDVYKWQDDSTYIRRPPWFEMEVQTKTDIIGARVLCLLEDKVTTDHISPAGSIPYDSPAGRYLRERGIDVTQFSTYGSRRGNHEVMVRGGFSNIRLKNLLGQGREGGWTTHLPSGELMTIYDASVRYQKEKVPLIVIAGKEYGAGSSRDWAAKAPLLLGVRAVIAESFERIHRSNLIAMGILPLEFSDGESFRTLGLNGKEVYNIKGIADMAKPNEILDVEALDEGNNVKKFKVKARIDNIAELNYFRAGGILKYVFAKLI